MTDVRRSIEQLKKDAKRLKHELGITHTDALNRVAVVNGFSSWEALQQACAVLPPPLSVPLMPFSTRAWSNGSWQDIALPACFSIDGVTGAGKSVLALHIAKHALVAGFRVRYAGPYMGASTPVNVPSNIWTRLVQALCADSAFESYDTTESGVRIPTDVPERLLLILEEPTVTKTLALLLEAGIDRYLVAGSRVVLISQVRKDLNQPGIASHIEAVFEGVNHVPRHRHNEVVGDTLLSTLTPHGDRLYSRVVEWGSMFYLHRPAGASGYTGYVRLPPSTDLGE